MINNRLEPFELALAQGAGSDPSVVGDTGAMMGGRYNLRRGRKSYRVRQSQSQGQYGGGKKYRVVTRRKHRGTRKSRKQYKKTQRRH